MPPFPTMLAGHRAHTSRHRIRHLAFALIATTIATLTQFAVTDVPHAAHATVPIGPGYQIPNPFRDSIIGGYRAPDGSILYCLDWGSESPTGPNDPVLSVTSRDDYDGWSHLEVARVNYLISKWGQTNDNNQAAAVQMAIWMRHPGTRDPFFSEHRFVKATIRDATVRASIARWATAMNSEADTFTPQARAAIGSIVVVPKPDDPFAGEVRISGLPANVTGTIQLVGGIFAATDSSAVVGIHDGDVLEYRGVPADDELGVYTVSAQATFVMPGGPGDELVVWESAPGFQDLGQASRTIPDFDFTLGGQAEIQIPFSPQLSTVAANTTVMTGEPLIDTIDFSLAEGSLPWRQLSDGRYVPVDAWCQAYGPLREAPIVGDLPPDSAPRFGDLVTVTVGGTDADPTATHVRAVVDQEPTRPGHYTFVCGISQGLQANAAGATSLPSEYAFQHEYGLVQETTVVNAPLAQTGHNQENASAVTWAAVLCITGLSGLGFPVWLRRRSRQAHL